MVCCLQVQLDPEPQMLSRLVSQVCFFLLSGSLSYHGDTSLVTPVKREYPFLKNFSKRVVYLIWVMCKF